MLRIVVDTNILVSAALKRGGDHHLQELSRYGHIRIRTVSRFLRTLERLERWRSLPGQYR